MIDIHSHVLPGVDDGAKNLTESINMLQQAANLGITKLYATPHAKKRIDWVQMNAVYLQTAAEARKCGIELMLGSELLYDLLLKLNGDELYHYCYKQTLTLLLEFHSQIVPPRWEYTLSALRDTGYRVIIAHPERYRFIQENIELVTTFRRYGAMLQLDAESLMGKPWDRIYRTACAILKQGFADFVSSDAHNVDMYQQYASTYKKYSKYWPKERDVY